MGLKRKENKVSWINKIKNIFYDREESRYEDNDIFVDVETEQTILKTLLGETDGKAFYKYLHDLFSKTTPKDFQDAINRMTSISAKRDEFNVSDTDHFQAYCLGMTDGVVAVRGVSKLAVYSSLTNQQICYLVKMKSMSLDEYTDAEFYVNKKLFDGPIKVVLFDTEDGEDNVYIKTETTVPILSKTVELEIISEGDVLFKGTKLEVLSSNSNAFGEELGGIDDMMFLYHKNFLKYNN